MDAGVLGGVGGEDRGGHGHVVQQAQLGVGALEGRGEEGGGEADGEGEGAEDGGGEGVALVVEEAQLGLEVGEGGGEVGVFTAEFCGWGWLDFCYVIYREG